MAKAILPRATGALRGISTAHSSALDGNVLHFSLSGTGTSFISWMFGFCSELQKSDLFGPNSTAHGVSGGATAAAFLAAGIDMSVQSETMGSLQEVNAKCRKGESTLADIIPELLERTLHEDDVARVSGRAHVCFRDGSAPLLQAMRSTSCVTVSSFSDKADLVEALLAACHIPFALDGTKSRRFRGQSYIDYGPMPQNFAVGVDASFVNVNVFPHPSWTQMPAESFLSRRLVSLYGGLTNHARAPVHVHPWLVPHFSLSGVVNLDDLRLRPLCKQDLEERHRLGQAAFHVWKDACEREA